MSVTTEPCGGCGEPDPKKACIGCLHFHAPTTRETADHAELARRLRVSWSDRGWVAANKIKELLGEAREAADALENLLSEIAALRGDLTETRVAADLLVSSVRADLRQAERQRDELRKALEPFATYPLAVKMDGTVAPDEYQLTGRHDKEGNFRTVTNRDFQRARQAITNQGADQ